MGTQKRNILICLAAIVVLCGVYYGVSRPKATEPSADNTESTTGENPSDESNFIIETTDFKAKSLTVEGGGEKETFIKDGTNWVMEGKENIGLVQISIDQLIAYAKNLEYTQIVADNMNDIASYGIDNGNKITITGDDGTVIKLTIGAKTVDEMGYYVTADGKDSIYMVGPDEGKALKKTPSDLRDRFPEYVNYNDCKYITVIKDDGTSYTLEPNPNGALSEGYGEYILTGFYSHSIPVDTAKLSQSIGGPLYETAAVKFIDKPDDLSAYGLDNPQLTINAEDIDGNKCTIEFGSAATDVTTYAKFSNKDYVCTVSTANMESIKNASLFNILIKSFVTLPASEISKISIEEDRSVNRSLKAVFDIDGETIKYNGKEISTDDFSTVYKNLIGLTIDGQVNGEAGKIEAEIIIESKNGESQSLKFHDYDTNYYAVEWDGSTEFLMGRKTLDILLGSIEKL